MAFLNTNTASSETVTFRPMRPLVGALQSWSYSAGAQNATSSEIVHGTLDASSLSHGLSLPPESMVVLEQQH